VMPSHSRWRCSARSPRVCPRRSRRHAAASGFDPHLQGVCVSGPASGDPLRGSDAIPPSADSASKPDVLAAGSSGLTCRRCTRRSWATSDKSDHAVEKRAVEAHTCLSDTRTRTAPHSRKTSCVNGRLHWRRFEVRDDSAGSHVGMMPVWAAGRRAASDPVLSGRGGRARGGRRRGGE
jgi:hypothetical protein